MDTTQTPNLPEPEAIQGMVVYDSKTGAIVHRHLAVRYPGGRTHELPDLEKRALELTAARGMDTKRLRVLHVNPSIFDEDVEYRVDVKRRTLEPKRRKSRTHADLLKRKR